MRLLRLVWAGYHRIMSTIRKSQPWGVRTIYRDGRSRLVGPYRGYRAAVQAQVSGGNVLSSTSMALPGVTGQLRVLDEKRLIMAVEVPPEPPIEGPYIESAVYDGNDTVTFTGANLTLHPNGPADLLRVSTSPVFATYIDFYITGFNGTSPGGTVISGLTDTTVTVEYPGWAGETLYATVVATEDFTLSNQIDLDTPVYVGVLEPTITSVTAPGGNDILVTGTDFITNAGGDIDNIEVYTLSSGPSVPFHTYYPTTSPDFGLNPPGTGVGPLSETSWQFGSLDLVGETVTKVIARDATPDYAVQFDNPDVLVT